MDTVAADTRIFLVHHTAGLTASVSANTWSDTKMKPISRQTEILRSLLSASDITSTGVKNVIIKVSFTAARLTSSAI